MFGLFKKNEPTEPDAEASSSEAFPTAPGTEIRYSPELVEKLKEDHKDLIELYGQIAEEFAQADYKAVSQSLARFRGLLQGHLLTENVRLYIYLDRQFAHDDTKSELIRKFRREMDGIGRAATNFLRKYEAIGVNTELADAFKRDFNEVGQVLVQRIEREESTLYPLYMPTY
ncbi:hemerythrin domain-containing protein [Thiohalomonas denitrificans]|uniref:Hemerythrin HHE cation binding domain-containing protein n=1 Tax=Thiohalomonas denitrificans TaxID=415747 RepID=A0A1G5Q9E0_9GAMM|nr:hemerythrin domain-containing protein [Thiohalomonas denitrificans]SCZ58485.1 Hemerythrin HHE cation binding domain-containing protein [Thiohalomonas denitrificans]